MKFRLNTRIRYHHINNMHLIKLNIDVIQLHDQTSRNFFCPHSISFSVVSFNFPMTHYLKDKDDVSNFRRNVLFGIVKLPV